MLVCNPYDPTEPGNTKKIVTKVCKEIRTVKGTFLFCSINLAWFFVLSNVGYLRKLWIYSTPNNYVKCGLVDMNILT